MTLRVIIVHGRLRFRIILLETNLMKVRGKLFSIVCFSTDSVLQRADWTTSLWGKKNVKTCYLLKVRPIQSTASYEFCFSAQEKWRHQSINDHQSIGNFVSLLFQSSRLDICRRKKYFEIVDITCSKCRPQRIEYFSLKFWNCSSKCSNEVKYASEA